MSASVKLGKFGNADSTMIAVAIVGIVVLYFIAKKTVTAAAGAVGGVVSGNNALTSGTPYAGAGILGTLGAAFNSASGGALQSAGESLGSGLFSLFGGSTASATAQGTQAATRDQVVTPNYIDDLSGAVGGSADTSSSLDSSYDFGLGTDDGTGGAWT
jgi:hypothetical protein